MALPRVRCCSLHALISAARKAFKTESLTWVGQPFSVVSTATAVKAAKAKDKLRALLPISSSCTRAAYWLVQFDRHGSDSTHPNIEHLHRDRKCHRKIDISLRHMHIETFRHQRDAYQDQKR